MKNLILILAAALLLPGCAAQLAMQNPEIREFTRADAQRALEIAQMDPDDALANNCWAAALPELEKAVLDLPDPIGVLSTYQTARYYRRHSEDSLVSPETRDACRGMAGESILGAGRMTLKELLGVLLRH